MAEELEWVWKHLTLKEDERDHVDSDKQRVIDGSPWSFDKQLLTIKESDGNLRTSVYVFGIALFWVRIHGLPFNLMSKEVVVRIGRKLGALQTVDTMSAWGKYMRVRVELDINKPWRRFVTIAGPLGKDDLLVR
ncbi:hypothetical protein CRYUN_Cryun05aG0115400 [Craigia yunnanensis]